MHTTHTRLELQLASAAVRRRSQQTFATGAARDACVVLRRTCCYSTSLNAVEETRTTYSSNSSFLANTSTAIAWVALKEALMRPAIDMS